LPGAIRLVVGLGNPGKDYERSRHNAGFWLVERFAVQSGVALRKDGKFQALVGRLGANGAWLVLPQGFMNASGRPVQMLAGFFKIPAAEILVVHDELDFAPGVAKMKLGGGIAGHNGLKDISQRLGTHEYWRLRLGIGHPGDKNAVAGYVLQKPLAEERDLIDAAIARGIEVLPLCLSGDLEGAMQKLHTVEKEKPAEKKAVEKRPEPKAEKKIEAKPEPAPEKGRLKGLFSSLLHPGRKK
jgi:peptidyl-tRNA hydrolase, PTH1 family